MIAFAFAFVSFLFPFAACSNWNQLPFSVFGPFKAASTDMHETGIFFNNVTDTFHLLMEDASYVMRIGKDAVLEHIHWGSRLNRLDDISYLLRGNEEASFDPGQKNYIMHEYADYGTGDFRIPAFRVRNLDDGSSISPLQYRRHRIQKGKPSFEESMPQFRATEDDAMTLVVEMVDKLKGLEVHLSFTVYPRFNVVTRSTTFQFTEGVQGPGCLLELVNSAQVDFVPAPRSKPYHLTQLTGSWGRERQVVTRRIDFGMTGFESRRGASSHQANPFVVVSEGPLDENHGRHYALGLVYSGSFSIQMDKCQSGLVRVTAGIHPDTFEWHLRPGTTFQTPESVLAYSPKGMSALSRNLHRLIRTHLLAKRPQPGISPVLVNSWEAMYFWPTEQKIMEQLVEPAKRLGLDMVVLDDGWFVNRNDDKHSLGDWQVDRNKFPHGLRGLSDRVNAAGLQLGIWMEPEMISKQSSLFHQHPDWCLHVPGRNQTESRSQLVLDLSRSEVQDFVVESVTSVIQSANISYLKWDFNRHLTEIGNEVLPAERQGELLHRWVLGLYSILARLRKALPDLVIEGCSGGGGRFDLGMLFYSPQIWTSDNTDAIGRTLIQWGTSLFYPPVSMTAHVSVTPNHQLHRSTPMGTRHTVAMAGLLGYELDLAALNDEESEMVKDSIVFWKSLIQPLIFNGDMYRLSSPFTTPGDDPSTPQVTSWMYVSEDQSSAVVFCVLTSYYEVVVRPAWLPLQGLDKDAMYKVEKRRQFSFQETSESLTVSGQTLMHAGLIVKMNSDADSLIYRLTRVS